MADSSETLDREDIGLHVRRSHERSVRTGEVIFDAGDEGRNLFVVQSGEVELSRPDGERWRPVAQLGPGDFFGELSVLVGGRRRVRAAAISDVRLLEVEGATLQAMCVERPEVAIRVIRRLAARVIHLEQRLSALGADDLVRPVVRVLACRARHTENGVRVATTLQRIAREAGLSMLEAHRALQQLFERRVVRLSGEELEVPDPDALARSAD